MLANFDIVASLPAADYERAKRFYEEKLGLTPISEDAGGAHYRSGSTYFDVYPTQFSGTAQHTLAAWLVDDLESTMEELRSRGIVFEEYDMPGLKTVNGVAEIEGERGAWFKDSEGNILAIAQVATDFRNQ
ncbi:MAG: VOC family protein [Actinomycetota bacterium]|nr:VOC family protein [Actinomycetota bacterium]